MKEMTKARLLKTKGIIKKICVWTPVILISTGIALGASLIIAGGMKTEKGKNSFKESDLFKQHYTQVYEDAKQKYDNGEIDMNEFNQTFSEINDENYYLQAMEELGDEAKEYREMIKTGNKYSIGAISGLIMTAGGLATLFAWAYYDIGDDLRWASYLDMKDAEEIKEKINKEQKEKEELKNKELEKATEDKHDDGFVEENEEEEEDLPSIDDEYYRD